MSDEREIDGPVVFFTGAGISVGAGLPTYRGTGGIYESSAMEPPNITDVTRERLPALWDRFRSRLAAFEDLRPAPAHRHIAELGRRRPGQITVVTQNVDGLHEAAGSEPVWELHGTLRTMRCLHAEHVHDVHDAMWEEGDAPRCPTCGDMCRPNVVLFGESLPQQVFAAAEAAIGAARTIVAVGTSAQVYPAAYLIGADTTGGARCLWINPETEPPRDSWQWLQGTADEQVLRLR